MEWLQRFLKVGTTPDSFHRLMGKDTIRLAMWVSSVLYQSTNEATKNNNVPESPDQGQSMSETTNNVVASVAQDKDENNYVGGQGRQDYKGDVIPNPISSLHGLPLRILARILARRRIGQQPRLSRTANESDSGDLKSVHRVVGQ